MSEGTQSIADQQAVVGEPVSQPHHAIVVGEPPEAVAPVLGEPAFANGVPDQQLGRPPSAEETSANGVQSPLYEEGLASFVPPYSHVSAPPSGAPIEESLNVQHALEANDSGLGEVGAHHSEPPVSENPDRSDFHTDDVSGALHTPVVGSTAATSTSGNTFCNTQREPATDIPDVVEVPQIVGSSSEASSYRSEGPAEQPFVETAPEDAVTGNVSTTDEISLKGRADRQEDGPTANASSTTDEVALNQGGDQQEASQSSSMQVKQSGGDSAIVRINTNEEPQEGNNAVKKDMSAAELEQVGEGDSLTHHSDVKETGLTVVEHAVTPEIDQASERNALVPGNDVCEDIPSESETASKEVGHSASKEVAQSEASTGESATCKLGTVNENQTVPIKSQNNEDTPVEGSSADSSVAHQGTREVAVEECLISSPPAVEALLPLVSNGDNGYQHGEDILEREQDLPKVDRDASAKVEKGTSRSKFPLIFTGLAIAAVGVAVASISRPH